MKKEIKTGDGYDNIFAPYVPNESDEAVAFMKRVLPDHYTCKPRSNGVHCHSPIGVDDCDPEHWYYIYKAIQQKFGDNFMEVYCQTCTNYMKFTVFVKFEN